MKLDQSLHAYRLPSNPEEERFLSAWTERNRGEGLTPLIDLLMDTAGNSRYGRAPTVAARDRIVAATVIQCLGSPVGQGFLRDLGYSREAKR